MVVDDQDTPAAAAGLTEYATVNSTSLELHPLKRKRAITPSGTNRDLEKQPLVRDEKRQGPLVESGEEQGTFLYLAYGSNLAASTFKGTRGVKPLRAVNVHVPDLELTFDLAGIAYTEPCFANTRYRRKSSAGQGAMAEQGAHQHAPNRGWSKGLVGVVYQVTAADYKHIIETEGGGRGYADVEVPCFLLAQDSKTLPDPESYPTGRTPLQGIPEPDQASKPFLAHTLLAPSPSDSSHMHRQRGWAQPSPRYLGLIRTGSRENGLPVEYIEWLDSLQPYEKTSLRQKIGGAVFLNLWGPLILPLVRLGPLFGDKNGIVPKWYGDLIMLLFGIVWWSYDKVFLPLAGDGERTVGT